MADFTLEDVYGSAPAAPSSSGGKEFSLEDVYGPQHQSDSQIALGGVKAAGKAVAGELGTIGDLITSVPGAAAGSIGELALRAGLSGDKSVGQKSAASTGREFREMISEKASPSWFSDLVKHFSDGEEAEPTHVAKALTWLNKKIDEGGEKIDSLTGGKINKDDASMFANLVMNSLGLKATMKSGAAIEGKVKEALKSPEEPKADPEAKYPMPEIAADPKLRAKVDIERATGLADADKRAAKLERMKKDAIKAFGDDAKYTAYLKEHADAESARALESLPKIDEGMLGKADPKLLAGIGAGVGGTLLARAYPDEMDKGIGLGLAIGGALPREGMALGSILKEGHNTLSTLERLPQNRTEFPKTMIEEQLRRPDVTKAEKELVTDVLSRWGNKETISAADLAKGVKVATQDFTLGKKDVRNFADYGLESIDREDKTASEYLSLSDEKGKGAENDPTRTSIWKLPEHLDLGTANHFGEPGYFGHTRSFDEGGVKHVVEIQSDLAQKAKQQLHPAEVQALAREYRSNKEQQAVLEAKLTEMDFQREKEDRLDYDDTPTLVDIQRVQAEVQQIKLRRREIETKLSAHEGAPPDLSRISPMLKNWDRRLVREELADSARKGEKVVRFASADTVAKVEGWLDERLANRQWRIRQDARDSEYEDALAGRGTPKFLPEHQGIYDRYSKDITKFLKNLGGKEVTDEHGHTWIETPTGAEKPSGMGRRAQMFGGATTDTLKGIAAVSLGLVAGANLDSENPIEGAVLGAIGGAGLITGAVPKLITKLREIAAPDTRIRINDLTQKHEHQIGAAARAVWQVQQSIIALVPDRARREAIHNAIDAGKVGDLKGNEAKAAKIAQDFYEQIGKAAQDRGVLDETRDNYTTHLWKTADKEKLQQILSAKTGQKFSPNSRFAEGRTHVTLAEGKAAGLKPMTEDLAEVIGMYGNAISRSIANRTLIDNLKKAKGPDGQDLVRKAKDAPLSYELINTPSMQHLRVHPDIAPSLRFVMESQEPGAIVAATTALNTALKRTVVSFSLFHAKALADAMLGAVKNPLTVGKVIAQAAAPRVFGRNRYLQQLRDGGAGDLPDRALRDGLKFSYEKGESAVEDVGGGFYNGMKILQNTLDKAVPGLGSPIAGFTRVNHAFDNFMWGRLHAAMKLEVYAAKTEALLQNSAKSAKPHTQQSAGEIAARYTNDVFGGLNWQRIAEGATTRWGRDLSLAMLSPKGRTGLQLLMFAPDWTLTTARAFLGAFKKGSGVKGLFNATAEGDLYRQQLVRSALYYTAIGDAVNYANSGHHIWENKDPFRVDLGDGRTMQLSKHFTEPFEWMQHPGQMAINKLGILPKEGIEQAMGVDYLSSSGRMPPMKNPVRHALGNTVPIGLKPVVEGQPGAAQRAISSSLGVPIYGKTEEEKREARFKAAKERYQKHLQELQQMQGQPQPGGQKR